MTISITTSPSSPTVKTKCRVTFGATVGNFVRVWLTVAPQKSKFTAELEQSRVLVHEADIAQPFAFEPDAPGRYVFTAAEITKGASVYGGGYRGDPKGLPTETIVGESEHSIAIGSRLEMPIGTGKDTGVLAFHVFGDTVRATTKALHGEVTPAIVNANSEKAKLASIDDDVTTALAALVNQPATTILGSPSGVASNIIATLNAHRTQAGVHFSNDGDNIISTSFALANSPAALMQTSREILNKLDRHMRNDNGGGTGSASPDYHDGADSTAALVATPPGEHAAAIVALADAWRAYEAHRVNSVVHDTADGTNTLTALPPLLNLHRRFLEVIQPLSPPAPPTANAGVVTLIGGGMRLSSP
jgi:hypothetical protein